ncbi:MAG: hypothetical protein V1799_11745 [bacterium]
MKDKSQRQITVETELTQLLVLQAQLRREIEFTRTHQLSAQDALRKLTGVNSRLNKLKKKLDKGRLFDPQMDLF